VDESTVPDPPRSRRTFLIVGVAAAVVVVVLIGAVIAVVRSRSSTPDAMAQQVAVPAYISPVADRSSWDRLIAADSRSVGLVVANPASGPGAGPDPAWLDVITRAHASGKQVLGYVDSGYLGRTGLPTRTGSATPAAWQAQIEADVAHWYEWYPGVVDGVFLDQGDSQCGAADAVAARYRSIDDAVAQAHAGATTVLNAGMPVPRCFENAADVLVTYENNLASYATGSYRGLDWTPADPAKVWHIVHGVPADQVDDVTATARSRGAGWVYATDDVLPNPYDTLPAGGYWRDEVQAVPGRPPGTAHESAP
jgi:hypothetical protein